MKKGDALKVWNRTAFEGGDVHTEISCAEE